MGDMVQLDRLAGVVYAPYSLEAVEKLLAAAEGHDVAVVHTALYVLLKGIRDWDIPEDVLRGKIVPRLSRSVERNAASKDEGVIFLRKLAGTVLWYVGLRELSHEQRMAALGVALSGLDWTRRTLAVDRLVRIGTEEAEEVLRKGVQSLRQKGLREYAGRTELGITRIHIQKRLDALTATGKVSLLSQEVSRRAAEKRGWGKREYVIWLIGKVAEVKHPSAVAELKRIWLHESLYIDYREAAQNALLRLKQIAPEDKRIILSIE